MILLTETNCKTVGAIFFATCIAANNVINPPIINKRLLEDTKGAYAVFKEWIAKHPTGAKNHDQWLEIQQNDKIFSIGSCLYSIFTTYMLSQCLLQCVGFQDPTYFYRAAALSTILFASWMWNYQDKESLTPLAAMFGLPTLWCVYHVEKAVCAAMQ